ncbi:MAG: hypothetical protein ACRDJW_02280 [Thermomicrobiales bacterium]
MVSATMNPMREDGEVERLVHRVEHRADGQTTVVARTSDVYARQQELSLRAAEFLATAATGELVLVEEATGMDAARRILWPETSASAPAHHDHTGQHDGRGWLGDARSVPSWSPSPLPNQHRFADAERRNATSSDCHRRDDPAS